MTAVPFRLKHDGHKPPLQGSARASLRVAFSVFPRQIPRTCPLSRYSHRCSSPSRSGSLCSGSVTSGSNRSNATPIRGRSDWERSRLFSGARASCSAGLGRSPCWSKASFARRRDACFLFRWSDTRCAAACGLKWILVILTLEGAVRVGMLVSVIGAAWHRL